MNTKGVQKQLSQHTTEDQHVSSPGNMVYSYAELAVSSIAKGYTNCTAFHIIFWRSFAELKDFKIYFYSEINRDLARWRPNKTDREEMRRYYQTAYNGRSVVTFLWFLHRYSIVITYLLIYSVYVTCSRMARVIQEFLLAFHSEILGKSCRL